MIREVKVWIIENRWEADFFKAVFRVKLIFFLLQWFWNIFQEEEKVPRHHKFSLRFNIFIFLLLFFFP